jgi:branched-chain amino acid transport system ATP-binding protein
MKHPDAFAVQDLSVAFGVVHALQNVTLNVPSGSIVGLIGPNGAGKSTLLNCISGLSRPTQGDIRLGDKSLVGMRPDQIAELGIGRVFQHPQIIPSMSVLDNLLIGFHQKITYSVIAEMLSLAHVRQTEAKAIAAAIAVAEQIGLNDYLRLEAGSLPYGHRKLLELGRAMLTEPKYLLLDEPIAGLNDAEIDRLCVLLLDLRMQSQLSVLLVEHNMGLVRKVCDSVVVLDAGKVISTGTPAHVLSDPSVLLAYLGEVSDHA